MVDIFNKKVLDVFTSMIPNKKVSINDKDAPWVTFDVKSAIRGNTKIYKKWVKNGRLPGSRGVVNRSQVDINKLIRSAKSKYTNEQNKFK